MKTTLRTEVNEVCAQAWFVTICSPGWCGSVGWVPAGLWTKGSPVRLPGLWARSPVRGAWEVTTHGYFSPSLSSSFPLCLKIKKIFGKKKQYATLKSRDRTVVFVGRKIWHLRQTEVPVTFKAPDIQIVITAGPERTVFGKMEDRSSHLGTYRWAFKGKPCWAHLSLLR